jgi:hypothetical protein
MHHVAKTDVIMWCENIELIEPEATASCAPGSALLPPAHLEVIIGLLRTLSWGNKEPIFQEVLILSNELQLCRMLWRLEEER